MHQLKDQQADMVITSPPYFSDETERVKKPSSNKKILIGLKETWLILLTLKPVLKRSKSFEDWRCLCRSNKDLRFGGFIIPLVDLHAIS